MTATKPGKALKAFLETSKTQSRLVGHIDRMLQLRAPEDRALDVLHPSEMATSEWCLRASCYLLSGRRVAAERPALRLRSIFDEGHAIHHKWQMYTHEGGWLYGEWACKADYCDYTWWDLSPSCCPGCLSANIKYAEVPLINDTLRIAGHADGWVKGLGKDFLIEIKSIGPGTIRKELPMLFEGGGDINTAWRNIKRPFTTHLRQGKLYLALGQLMVADGLLESFPDEIVFLYELKQDQDYKEFVVQHDPDSVAEILGSAALVVDTVNDGQILPCNIDPVKGCKKCRPFDE